MDYRSVVTSRSQRSNSVRKVENSQQFEMYTPRSNSKYKYLNPSGENIDFLGQQLFKNQSSRKIDVPYTEFGKYSRVNSSRSSLKIDDQNGYKNGQSRYVKDYLVTRKLEISRDHRYRNANYLKKIYQIKDQNLTQALTHLSSSRYEKENYYENSISKDNQGFEVSQKVARKLFEEFQQELQQQRISQSEQNIWKPLCQQNTQKLKKAETQKIHQKNISALRQITKRYQNTNANARNQPLKRQKQLAGRNKEIKQQKACMTQRSHRRIIQIRQIIKEQYSDQQ